MEKITKSSDKVLIDPNEPLILPDGTALVGRVEWFLYALCCLDYQNLPTPMSRIEEFANALITGEIPNIQPQSRAEQFFLAILDGNISDLPQPQSRSEVLLDKLARGEFDLSDVEPIQSRYELLLAYLIKNGGIGNIDYVLYEFSEAMKTMYNTVEKPFKSLELSGNTLVNCVLEDTENDDYTSFDKDYSGTSFTINGTSEGAIKSATLKGQTLVNLVPKKIIDYTASNDWDGFHALVQNSTKPNEHWRTLQDLKPNTKYYVSCYVETFEDVDTKHYHFNNSNNYCVFADFMKVNGVGHYQWISRTKSELTDETYIALRCQNAYARGRIKIRDIMIIEYQEGMENWDIPYFEGMASVKAPVLESVGKNLFDGKLENGFLSDSTGQPTGNSNHRYTPSFIKIDASKKYCLHAEADSFIGIVNAYYYDDYKNYLGFGRDLIVGLNTNVSKLFTPHYRNASYIRFRFFKPNNVELPVDPKNIAFYESSTIIDMYEPYKSHTLTTPEDLELHSIKDTKYFNGSSIGKNFTDVLNYTDSELKIQTNKVVMDGNKQPILSVSKGNVSIFKYKPNDLLIDSSYDGGNIFICDKLKFVSALWEKDEEGYCYSNNDGIMFSISNNKFTDINEYLSQNPITFIYPLAQESIKTVDLNVVDQNNTKIDKIHVFNETTHVNASSDELTPTVNIGKSVSYPTIIKPNTKYTVDLKRNDKPLTVNLGGTEVAFSDGETRKTITTPSTLTNDKLSYYGIGAKCNEIMLIEGEVEGNVDYFTGMQSVKAPSISTIGKNLFDFKSHSDKRGSYSMGYPFETNSDLVSGGTNLTYLDNGFTYTTQMNSFNNGLVYYVKLKKQTNYNISMNIESNQNEYALKIFGLYENEIPLKNAIRDSKRWLLDNDTSNEFNLSKTFSSKNFEYAIIYIGGAWSSNAQGQRTFTFTNIQLEEGTQNTAYEPYKSSILSYNDDVTLRGTGDVRDTLDCLTGEIVERVGVGVFDGSEDEGWQLLDSNDNYVTFVTYRPLPNIKDNKNSICDKLPFQGHMTPEDGEYHSVQSFGSYINVLSSKASNVVEFKNWLSQNNLTIYYPLTTESIKTVDLSVVDQDGNTIPKVKSYNSTTHLEVTIPKQSLLPNVSAEVATDNSKDMSSLTIKHQEISETQSAIQDNIQSQSDEIDTALMATTEIFESILE